jgi:hypothetical protein
MAVFLWIAAINDRSMEITARNWVARDKRPLLGSGAKPQQSPETASLAGQGQRPCLKKLWRNFRICVREFSYTAHKLLKIVAKSKKM